MRKALIAGLITDLVLQTVLSGLSTTLLPPLLVTELGTVGLAQSSLVVFVSVFVGAILARGRFAIAATALQVAYSLVMAALLYYVGVTFPGHLSFIEILQVNALLFLASCVVAFVAAVAGGTVHRRFQARPAASVV